VRQAPEAGAGQPAEVDRVEALGTDPGAVGPQRAAAVVGVDERQERQDLLPGDVDVGHVVEVDRAERDAPCLSAPIEATA
jgi:hypothetical protein